MSKPVNILAIESSCDETSAAVVRDGVVLSNLIATQKVHERFGGVVPELASRAHMQNIVPVVDVALKEAGVDKKDIQAVAFTQAPGLIGSLRTGAECSADSCTPHAGTCAGALYRRPQAIFPLSLPNGFRRTLAGSTVQEPPGYGSAGGNDR